MATANFDTIAAAIAARFAAAALTAPAGYATIRSSTANPPGAIGPTPAVVVTMNTDDSADQVGNGLRVAVQSWHVRFYFDQTSDLERTEPALRKWHSVLYSQLKGAVQLAGLVDWCRIMEAKLGILAYGGVDYTGIEFTVHTATSEAWAATA